MLIRTSSLIYSIYSIAHTEKKISQAKKIAHTNMMFSWNGEKVHLNFRFSRWIIREFGQVVYSFFWYLHFLLETPSSLLDNVWSEFWRRNRTTIQLQYEGIDRRPPCISMRVYIDALECVSWICVYVCVLLHLSFLRYFVLYALWHWHSLSISGSDRGPDSYSVLCVCRSWWHRRIFNYVYESGNDYETNLSRWVMHS